MDVGCGWGLAGIYCAKTHGALVTSVDIDAEVFPYLQLHAGINNVDIATMTRGFEGVRGEDLRETDVVIGADICYWDATVGILEALIQRALATGVQLVLIADPGRSPFEELAGHFSKNGRGNALHWAVDHPHAIHGRILRIRAIP
jgi:predicted nicotinamide N-methyase